MIEYKQEGWHVHSGAQGQYQWWLACYREGEMVAFYRRKGGYRAISFKTSESAQRRADALNRRDGFA